MSIYAVNGKVPISAWIPSLDTLGNGTTTLNDLVGTNHGTFSNMEPATDWVANTESGGVRALDFGGVRALDFDGVNESVRLGTDPIKNNTQFSVSIWFKLDSVTPAPRGLFGNWNSVLNGAMIFRCSGQNLQGSLSVQSGGVATQVGGTFFSGLSSGVWYHAVLVYNGVNIKCYLNNGVSETVFIISGPINPIANISVHIGGGGGSQGNFDGLIDDLRIWPVELDASDVAYLYNSGSGRGRVASGGPINANRNNMLVGC